MKIVVSEHARLGMERLKMNEQQVLDFILGPESEKNAVCVEENGHRYCHRQMGCATVWMGYFLEECQLVVDKIYHHRVLVMEDSAQEQSTGG